MLKWTIPARRDGQDIKSGACFPLSSNFQSTESLPHTPRQKTKRRRSSTSRKASTQKRRSLDALEADKENQFHSTPIKNNSSSENFSPFRDVSNLTPNDTCKRVVTSKTKVNSPKFRIKKKKECLESHDDPRVSDSSVYFKPFEAVDSHIESILAEQLCSCKKPLEVKIPSGAKTPKIYSFGIVDSVVHNVDNSEGCPPTKKPKVKSADDAVSPTGPIQLLPVLKLDPQKKKVIENEVRVSPLVRRFLDLKFSRASLEKDHENSSFINDMSLDRLVDVLLESSSGSNRATSLNSSLVVNVDTESEHDNEHNETKEQNMMNSEQDKQIELNSVASSDSGFKSSMTENSHQLDSNFLCKCNNNNPEFSQTSHLDKTIIQINETYNERCVDNESSRKRSAVTPEETDDSKRSKIDENCTLKRQRCVRRRKAEHLRKKLSRINSSVIESQTVSPFWSTQQKFLSLSDEESFTFTFDENTPLRGCYLENKDILRTAFADTPSDSNRTIRKCLVFESPRVDDSSFGDSTVKSCVVDVRGSVDLRIFSCEEFIYVNVIKCQDLFRPDGENINAYVKVAISDRLTSTSSRRKRNAVLQRTPVQSGSPRPIFNHTFKFAKVPADSQKRILLEVWHRARTTKTSEFLGCTSFDVKDVYSKVIEGSYRLLPQTEGRLGNVPITNDPPEPHLPVTDHQVSNMGENTQDGCGSVTEEIFSLDGVETELKRSTNKAILSEQQKYADENLFLRYLELDPTEGPDAIPAALQRKATGNRFGRTPFTQTKRLARPAKSGFGFSVVWTHPPRIERVEKGLPAERAGILPGDYIIFVDKHNVVMMPEIDILNLIRSFGSQLTLEIFRRNASRNGSVPSVCHKSTTIVTPSSVRTDSNVNLPSTTAVTALRRPSTVCSTNTTSMDYRRRKLNLPQVTFSSEKPTTNPEECRRRSIYQLIGKEQQYATSLQFAITRFVSALAERRDLITPSEHRILFQNCEELLRITEDILDHLVHEDGEMDTNLVARIYRCKLREITSAYKKYCAGIQKADCVLANKLKNSNSDFVKFVQCPTIPRRRPDLTSFIHKPLEHYREVLKLLMAIQSNTQPKHEDSPVINQIVHEMQVTYREITSEGGLMEPCGEGRPLLSVQDLENRLVFTKCKPFVLNKPGRQWIFGGDLSRVEGRNVRQYWTLLFSDLLLFSKASRDRVLFITEDPLPLAHVTDMLFNIRKKDTEFRICVNSNAKNQATSPTVHCGPDLSRTPKKNSNKKTVILRAPTTELKAVWQNLLQRQIFHLNSGMDGSSLSSPMESPEVPITSSVGTLHSVETCSLRRQPQNLANERLGNNNNEAYADPEVKKQIETLIEHKCKIMGKTSFNGKCNAVHLEQWMKGQLEGEALGSPVVEQIAEEWTEEMLRKRSEELQLIDSKGNVTASSESRRSESRCEEVVISDQEEQSPSKSTTTESQVTVRSSPVVPEAVQVCRQCHKNCLSNVLANNKLSNQVGHLKDCNPIQKNNNQPPSVAHNPEKMDNGNTATDDDDWQPLLLLGLCANPVASLVNLDPFQTSVSNVSDGPQSTIKALANGDVAKYFDEKNHCCCSNTNNCTKRMTNHISSAIQELEISPDDSPQTEEHPYYSLSSSAMTLRRYGTVSSLERYGSQDRVDVRNDVYENNCSSEESDFEEDDYLGIDNEAFNHSSILSWTARAGNYVAEKMTFFEKFGDDYKSGGGFFDRYLKSPENHINGEEAQEEETSGATSGEEVWGTPTSGGDLDDPLNSPNSPSYEGKLSPGSYSSDTLDDTELMMDELLMAPPITGAILRGLLPRRTLEPLIEEDFSESTTSSTSSDPTSPPSASSEQGNRTGSAADTCSRDVADLDRSEPKATDTRRSPSSGSASAGTTTSQEGRAHRSPSTPASWEPTISRSPSNLGEVQKDCVDGKDCCGEVSDSQTAQPSPSMPRSESYRKIVDAAEDSILEDNGRTSQDVVFFFDHFQQAGSFVNIERVPRSKSIRIFDFFNVRRTERRIYERYPENRPVINVFSKEDEVPGSVPSQCTLNNVSPKILKENRNGRFWRQLSRRRTIEKPTNPA